MPKKAREVLAAIETPDMKEAMEKARNIIQRIASESEEEVETTIDLSL